MPLGESRVANYLRANFPPSFAAELRQAPATLRALAKETWTEMKRATWNYFHPFGPHR